MELKDRLKAARKHAKLTQDELAGRIGVKQASISDLERGKSQATGFIARIANICGVDALWLESGKGNMTSADADALEPESVGAFRSVKIVGTAQMGTEGYWCELEHADGYIDAPTSDPDAYALRLKGNSMAPAIKSGWIAICEPNSPYIPGEYIMVRLHSGECMLKELLYANDEEISVASVNDAYGRRTIPIEEVDQMHYVGIICSPTKIRL